MSGIKPKFEPDSWVFGDIKVDENGELHTYRYAMLFSFRNLEEFREAKAVIDPLLEGGRSE